MKRILLILLMICVLFTAIMPMTAYAVEQDIVSGVSDSENVYIDQEMPVEEVQADAPEEISAVISEEAPENEPLTDISEEPIETPAEEITPEIAVDAPDIAEAEPPAEAPAHTPGEACEEQLLQISPLSEFIGEDNEFFTRIRLTVTDRQGNPLSGAVYGLYRMNGQLVEYLTTDAYGAATSGDVPVDTDYYIEEITPPTGYSPNTERREIILSEVCAPSLVGVTVEYDPIMGIIKVIKTDDYGYPLSGAGFQVYRSDTWEHVDTIVTGEDGTAATTDLPYGRYELYEYLVPEDYESGGGYYTAMIDADGEIVELTIVNYYNPPYIPPEEAYVSIYKTGNDGRVIPGVVFSIYKLPLAVAASYGDNGIYGEWMEDITTNGSGYAYSSALSFGDYYAVEKSVPDGYRLDDTPYYFSLYESWQTVYIDVVNERDGESGRVKIVKTDGNENPLDGVVFGLYRLWDNNRLAELATGGDGTAESDLLIPDDYYITELSGIDGYEFSGEPVYFTVDGSGKTVELSVVNPKIRVFGKVQVIKTDEAGAPLEGVRFGVYCHKGNLLEELTTGADGKATSGVLNDGNYYIVELEGLPGYISDTGEYRFSITENGTVVPVEIINHRIKGGVKMIKTDGENPLAGAVFAVFDGNGVQVCDLTTGADGAAACGNLTWGAYSLKEVTAPSGYILLPDTIPFEIMEQGETVEITVVNEKEPVPDPDPTDGRIRLIKKDADTGKLLTGAVFGVYTASSDIKVCELTTDTNGEAVSPLLTKGGYYLKELSAPAGYELSAEKYGVTVKADTTVEITVTNLKTPDPTTTPTPGPDPTDGKIRLIKKDGDTGKRLAGAVFGVYTASSDIKVCELTTDTNGEAVSPLLTEGGYYLKELSAPAGYELSAEKYGVTVKADNTVDITVTNKKTPGSTSTPDPTPTPTPAPAPNTDPIPVPIPATKGELLIVKKAEQTGNPLQGAVFGVYKVFGNAKITELTTNTDGKATLTLEPGEYYLKELKSPYGYLLEPAKIYFTVTVGATVKVDVTNIRDGSIPDGGNITIPKTGMDFPIGSYALTGLLWGIALLCGVLLYRSRKLKAS